MESWKPAGWTKAEAQPDERKGDEQMVRLGLVQIAKALVEGRIKPTMSDLDRMIRLKRELAADLQIFAMAIGYGTSDFGVANRGPFARPTPGVPGNRGSTPPQRSRAPRTPRAAW